MRFIDADEVRRRLTYDICIPLMREAMTALSSGRTRQLLRAILPLGGDNLFGVMPGSLGEDGAFGAKVISVFPGNFAKGGPSHQGLIVLFEPATGAPVCVVDAGEVTAIRTAATSAMATDVLSRPDAHRLALLGYGRQAAEHARAIGKVRKLSTLRVWGRDGARAAAFAEAIGAELALPATAAGSPREAVEAADIICTVTAATDPIVEGDWLAAGAHVNLVGSGHAGQAEADGGLVARVRFIADSREGVIAQGGEFLRAKAAGLVEDSHVVAEIGEVLTGTATGRRTNQEITAYKSLGHVAQDLTCAWALYTDDGHELLRGATNERRAPRVATDMRNGAR
ncbi:MAG TPA: ornithine cyclodeaminase family protein [Caulobacteraceae bacterium]